MSKLIFLVLFGFIALSLVDNAEAYKKVAKCNCAGCRPSSWSCNYDTFGGCDCGRCRCKTRPHMNRCCSNCDSLWGKKRKCWNCQYHQRCDYNNCSCK